MYNVDMTDAYSFGINTNFVFVIRCGNRVTAADENKERAIFFLSQIMKHNRYTSKNSRELLSGRRLEAREELRVCVRACKKISRPSRLERIVAAAEVKVIDVLSITRSKDQLND